MQIALGSAVAYRHLHIMAAFPDLIVRDMEMGRALVLKLLRFSLYRDCTTGTLYFPSILDY
jgi:hypothetical protein